MTVVGLDLAALQRYFDRTVPDAGPLQAELIAGGKSNLTYLVSDRARRWVLRRPPLGPLAPTAHDMAREYRIVAALHPTDVPVAEPVALCEDPAVIGAPFAVVRYVPGLVLRREEQAAQLAADQARAGARSLVHTLAQLHDVDFASVGLADFGRPAGYLARQVRRWRMQWDFVATRELPEVDRLAAALTERLPTHSDASIVHGDYRLDNVILDPETMRVAAVVDWEMATLGDPLADLGLLQVYWSGTAAALLGANLPSVNSGFPDSDELARHYAELTGRDLAALPAYRALGYFKLAVIAEGINQRHLAGHTVGDGFESAGTAVLELLAAGLNYVT
jgi:aminoglycoside phosphotransferase (APT) family kinase protein